MENLDNKSQVDSFFSAPMAENDAFKHYLYLIWQRQWLLWLCISLASASAFIFSWVQTPIYRASTTLLVSEARTPDANYQDLLLSERVATTYARWMTQPSVLEKVATALGMSKDELSRQLTDITILPVARTQMLNVAVEGPYPDRLMKIANTLPIVFIQQLNETQSSRFAEAKQSLEEQLLSLETQIAQKREVIAVAESAEKSDTREELNLNSIRSDLALYQESYARLRQSYETLRLTEINALDSIIVTQEAILPQNPIHPRPLNNTLLAALAGLLIALGAIFATEYLDDRILSPNDLRRAVATPFLGAITDFITLDEKAVWNDILLSLFRRREPVPSKEIPQLVTMYAPRHPIAEAYRGLRTNLRFSDIDNPLQTLLVTSANPGEGKSTTSANLAVVMAQSGLSVILIDCDLRKPCLHSIFGLSQTPGVTDVLVAGERGAELIEEDVNPFIYSTNLPTLRVLCSGQEPPNPSELLGSQRMQQLIDILNQQADIIIFDAPPLLAVTDARILGSRTQGVILVIDSSQTQRNVVRQAVDGLKQVNARLSGAVLNRITHSRQGYGYYHAYNSYYANEDSQHAAQTVPVTTGSVALSAMNQKAHIASN